MATRKRKIKGGYSWGYYFELPGSTRADRRTITKWGFERQSDAIDAEAVRRVEEQRKRELAAAGALVATVAERLPAALGELLAEFFGKHCDKKLAPKTVERYRECAGYLSPELLVMRIREITPLHLNREWQRLLESGGRTRHAKTPRPMSAKTVRNIAGVVSAAFGRAIKWGLVEVNPCTASEPPAVPKRKGMSLTTGQQDLLFRAAGGPWCLGTFLQVDAALGARRGEVLALRWSDIEGGRATIGRSLSQTRAGLTLKSTKSEEIRVVGLPAEALVALEVHRKRQDEFRRQFGVDYAAGDLIFANPDGTPLRPNSISSTVSALFKRLKIPKPKGAALHLLRHSHGSHLLASHVPLPAVSARLGHSSSRVTAEVYAHEIHGQDDEAVLKWEEFQRRAREQGGAVLKEEVN